MIIELLSSSEGQNLKFMRH